jgi:hypothetical protein
MRECECGASSPSACRSSSSAAAAARFSSSSSRIRSRPSSSSSSTPIWSASPSSSSLLPSSSCCAYRRVQSSALPCAAAAGATACLGAAWAEAGAGRLSGAFLTAAAGAAAGPDTSSSSEPPSPVSRKALGKARSGRWRQHQSSASGSEASERSVGRQASTDASLKPSRFNCPYSWCSRRWSRIRGCALGSLCSSTALSTCRSTASSSLSMWMAYLSAGLMASSAAFTASFAEDLGSLGPKPGGGMVATGRSSTAGGCGETDARWSCHYFRAMQLSSAHCLSQ